MWGIWPERKAHSFEGSERSTHDLKLSFFQTFECTNASGVLTFVSLADLLDCCEFLCTVVFIAGF